MICPCSRVYRCANLNDTSTLYVQPLCRMSLVTRSLIYYLQLITISWLLWLITVSTSNEATEFVKNNLVCLVNKYFSTASATKPKALLSK